MFKGNLWRQREHIASGILLFMFFSMAYCQTPVPDIKINNLDGPLVFSPSDNISVSVQLESEGRTDNADWFLAGNTSLGLFFYDLENWSDLVKPAVQIPLQSVRTLHLMDIPASALWPGDFTLYFGVDTLMDGVITWDLLYFDAVDFTVAGAPEDSRYIEAKSGGKLTVINKRGDLISLTIPPGSLQSSTTITMIVLDSAVSSPFSNKLLPGVVLSPGETVLQKPAKLKVKFATPPDQLEGAVFFQVKDSQLAYPLENGFYRLDELEGDIYHFNGSKLAELLPEGKRSYHLDIQQEKERHASPIEVVLPTESELIQAINAVLDQAIHDTEWLDNYATSKTLIEFQKIAQLLGYELADELAESSILAATSLACDKFFSDIQAPETPEKRCGKYLGSFLDVYMMLQEIGLESCTEKIDSEYLQQRHETFDEECELSNDFVGKWKIKLRPRYSECWSSLWKPYDCRNVAGISKDPVTCTVSTEEVMKVEVFPTSTGHFIKFPSRTVPDWKAVHFGHLPIGEKVPFKIDGDVFSFEYETNSTAYCTVYKEYVASFYKSYNKVCYEKGKVTGKISEDGQFLIGTDGRYEYDLEQVNMTYRPKYCLPSTEDEYKDYVWYTIQYDASEEGIFSGAKQ